jgi:amino acid ABC transporter substrate-binding protein, PAAT family (TC 3.A.1.3.-)
MVQAGRADIALVTRSYLSDFLARNPDSLNQLIASQRIDQVYHHYALLRPGAPITDQKFAELLRHLRDTGELTRIFQPYRITVAARTTKFPGLGTSSEVSLSFIIS